MSRATAFCCGLLLLACAGAPSPPGLGDFCRWLAAGESSEVIATIPPDLRGPGSVQFLVGGSATPWSEWQAPGTLVRCPVSLPEPGTFDVRARARDRRGLESAWTGPARVRVLPESIGADRRRASRTLAGWPLGVAACGDTWVVAVGDSLLFFEKSDLRKPTGMLLSRADVLIAGPDNSALYDLHRGFIQRIDAARRTIAASAELVTPLGTPVAAAASRVAVFVVQDQNQLLKLDPVTLAVLDSTRLGSLLATVCCSPDGRQLYVLDVHAPRVYMLDGGNLVHGATVQVHGLTGWWRMACLPDADRLLIYDNDNREMRIHEAGSLRLLNTVVFDAHAWSTVADDELLLALSSEQVLTICRSRDFHILQHVTLPAEVDHWALSADRRRLLCTQDHELVELEVELARP